MRYTLIVANQPNLLGDKVNAKLQESWQLYGDPFWADEFFCQAMIDIGETWHPFNVSAQSMKVNPEPVVVEGRIR